MLRPEKEEPAGMVVFCPSCRVVYAAAPERTLGARFIVRGQHQADRMFL